MRDDRAHVMQAKLCKANTRGVTFPFAEIRSLQLVSEPYLTLG